MTPSCILKFNSNLILIENLGVAYVALLIFGSTMMTAVKRGFEREREERVKEREKEKEREREKRGFA